MQSVLVIAAIVALILLFFSPGLLIVIFAMRKKATDRKLCHQCGYPVRGSASKTCPECGAAWRDSGERLGREGLEILVFLLLLLFYLIALPAAVFGFIYVMAGAV